MRILYCNCTYSRVVPEETKAEVLDGLVRSGVAFDAVPDLCELAAKADPCLERLAGGEREIRIAACYPRAVKWLFHRTGTPLSEDLVHIQNMRTDSGEQVLAGLLGKDSVGTVGTVGTDGALEAQAALETEAGAA